MILYDQGIMMSRLGCLRRATQAAVRRGLDVILASLALLIVAPAMLVIAVAIVMESPGPVFFSQIRLGRGGRHFKLHKFRKFRHEPEMRGPHLTVAGDPRLTRVGRVIERTKLDELPQLWNILVGDMSFVGPRPESLAFADCFTGPFRVVLDHAPGLLGPNQVIFRNEGKLFPPDRDPHEFYRTVLFPLKARIDVTYFSRRTLRLDGAWMVRGALAVCGLPVFGKPVFGKQLPETAVEIETWLQQMQTAYAVATALAERV